MPTETREEKYKRQTKEQFEELGRFVQAFEHMVDSTRTSSLQFTAVSPNHQRLLNIVFHHSALSAMPLLEIMRALYAEKIKGISPPADEGETIHSILSQIAKDYAELVSKRNNLLHGTWYVGWASADDADFSSINVSKYKATSRGFEASVLPKNVEELRALTQRCDDVRRLILGLYFAVSESGANANFQKINGRWQTISKVGP